ncbi:MAG: LSU ribosomal protein L10p (P0), partial [uncultured Sphingomonadaceae bacterium]
GIYGVCYGSCRKGRCRRRAPADVRRGQRGGRHPQPRPHRGAVHGVARADAGSGRTVQGGQEYPDADRGGRNAVPVDHRSADRPDRAGDLQGPGRRRQGGGGLRQDDRQVRDRRRRDGRDGARRERDQGARRAPLARRASRQAHRAGAGARDQDRAAGQRPRGEAGPRVQRLRRARQRSGV